jgi:peptide/nickel transport system substrate-binding protein
MRFRTAIVLTLLLTLLASACGDGDTETTTAATDAGTETTTAATDAGTETTAAAVAEAGGTLTAVRFESFDGWVLDSAAAYSSYQTHMAVIEPLMRFGADGVSIEPGLAESWDYDRDGLTLTFTLYEGASFSNGDPVTAADVEFSLGVWNEGPNFGGSWDAIVGVTGEGREIVMELAFADNTLLPVLASSISGIMPKDFAGMTADDYYANPIGAGAFVIDEWSIGGRIVMTPNEFYHDPERPYVDELILDVVTDEAERQILFDSGTAQIIEYLSPTVAPQYDAASVYVCKIHSVEHIGLNVLRPPFDDPLVRQAVAYAIDYDAIQAALGEYFGLPSGILAPNIKNWVPPTEPYFRRDLTKAADLLAQSSAAGGVSAELIYDVGNALDTLVVQIIQANLAEIGIDVTLSSLETGAFLDRAFSIDADMTIWNYGAISPEISDPLIWVAATGWLFSGFETDTLWDQYFAYGAAADDAEMQAIITEVQDGAFAEAAAIAVAEGSYLHGVDPGLTGFESAPWGLYYYDTISLGA